MHENVVAVRRILTALLDEPEKFTDDELCELADMAREMAKVAAKRFVDRLLAANQEA